MNEETYDLGEPIRRLADFVLRCNSALGRTGLVTAGSDGLISAVDLTPEELETIKRVNKAFDKLDSWEPTRLRDLTLAQVEAKVDSISNLTEAKAVIKTMARILLWLLKREMGEH